MSFLFEIAAIWAAAVLSAAELGYIIDRLLAPRFKERELPPPSGRHHLPTEER